MPRFSAGATTAPQHPRPSGGFTITMPASNTGSEEIPSNGLLKNLPEHFRNPAQIRYEMNKMKARDVISKSNNKSFYRVTKTGWKYLWLEICSVNHLKNSLISRIMKNQILKIAEQPSQKVTGKE
ncbi:MAG: hypothetical protein WA151_14440 [Desulfatirhabdiaceae bacterium]